MPQTVEFILRRYPVREIEGYKEGEVIMTLAIVYGLISGSTLIIGALMGVFIKIPQKTNGAIMAFASGVLISALTIDLMYNAYRLGGLYNVSAGFILGTIIYVSGDYLIDYMGGHFRKRKHGVIHEKKSYTSTDVKKGSGYAIFLGAILDGIPESLAIGIGLANGKGLGLSMMIAVFLSNFPEGISGANGMKAEGKTNRYIIFVWACTLAVTVFAVVLGYIFSGKASDNNIAVMYAIAAGGILSMIADTMMPEAYEEGGRAVALITALGFLLAFIVSEVA